MVRAMSELGSAAFLRLSDLHDDPDSLLPSNITKHNSKYEVVPYDVEKSNTLKIKSSSQKSK
jgi:hypothetical protein